MGLSVAKQPIPILAFPLKANLCTHLCRPLILLPSPTCGRGAGGEGEAKNNVYSFKAFPLPNPLPQAGEGTCVHRLACKGGGDILLNRLNHRNL